MLFSGFFIVCLIASITAPYIINEKKCSTYQIVIESILLIALLKGSVQSKKRSIGFTAIRSIFRSSFPVMFHMIIKILAMQNQNVKLFIIFSFHHLIISSNRISLKDESVI